MSQTSDPLVSAIVVNWNGARHLETCLASLLSQSYRPLEIIVVDNDSSDDSAAIVSRFGIRWHPLQRNLGLAPALNRGAEVAAGEHLLFLNNDMRFHENFVKSLVTQIIGDPDVFALDALQYDWDGTNQVHLAVRLGKEYRANSNSYAIVPALYVYQETSSSPTAIPTACAASMLVRKSMFSALGGFDERLPLGYEDLEICWRAWVRGWRSVFVPAAVCWHRVGGSSGSAEGSRLASRGILNGRLLFSTKLLPVRFAIRAWLTTFAGLARDSVALRWQRVWDRIGVLSENTRIFLSLVRERREIYRSQNTSPQQHLERLLRLGAV